MLFDSRVVNVGEWEVLSLVGDVDLASLPRLRQDLDRIEGPRTAVDLSGVDHMDPVALGALLLGSLRASRRQGRFVVVSPAGPARELLAETGLDRLLEVLDERSGLSDARI